MSSNLYTRGYLCGRYLCRGYLYTILLHADTIYYYIHHYYTIYYTTHIVHQVALLKVLPGHVLLISDSAGLTHAVEKREIGGE